MQLDLFWSYRKWFAGDKDLGKEILGNIAMFIPYGFLLSSVLLTFRNGKRRGGIVFGSAIVFSFTIEILQLVLIRGLFEWDDVFSNAVGTVIGMLLCHILNRWKYVIELVGLLFVAICLVVVFSYRNVDSGETDITSRLFCFQIDNCSCINGELTITGFTFRYDQDASKPTIILRSTNTEKKVILDVEQIEREDVNNYFASDYDYIDSGFKAVGRIDAGNYEILIRWPWSVAISTGVYIDSNGVYHERNKDSVQPDVSDAPDVKNIVENGIPRVYRQDYHCWVYQVGGDLYWIVDEDFYFELDGTTYIQYQLYTTQKDKLPQKRVENGWFWDNIGGYFEDYEIQGNFGPYRVMKRELPKKYSITSIVTGYYKDGEWVWKEYFRPVYFFDSDEP